MTTLLALPPTRTHKCRHCTVEVAAPGMVVLTIFEGPTQAKASQTGNYVVVEHEPTYCRRFRVKKSLNDGGESYWVGIGATFEEDSCDCKGFESSGLCKHRDAIRAIIEAGEFPAMASQTAWKVR